MNPLNHTRSAIAVALFCALATQSALACSEPKAPRAIPDGSVAGPEVMADARREVDGYLQRFDLYLACERDARKLQDAQARMTEVVTWFNAEARAYRSSRSPTLVRTRN